MRRRNRRSDPLGDAIAEGRAVPAGSLRDPEDADALRTAITLKAAQPAADLPSEAFVASLRQQIADEGAPRSRRRLSRRAVLGTAGAVAAGAAVGATAIALDRAFLAPDTGAPQRAAELDPVDGQWLGVASEAELAAGTPHRFATASLVGFVTATGDGLVAVSGACTHLGCILQQNDTAGRFDCPCHRTAFGHDGRLLLSQLPEAPAPLTRLQVRRREGSVEVLLPPPV